MTVVISKEVEVGDGVLDACAPRTKSCEIYLSFVGYFSLDLCVASLQDGALGQPFVYSITFLKLK